MKVVRTREELRQAAMPSMGFVPTMGALHEGHLTLMRQARAECGSCVISIFVNPTQFGPTEDYSKYPRMEDHDLALADGAGVDVVFLPSVDTMYGNASTTTISVGPIASMWEGALRPGHFEGVATVCAKLFHMVGAGTAYFGAKDYQQCLVIRRMVEDLAMPVRLRICQTVRESDGLALSSRNAYLSEQERAVAPRLYKVLCGVRDEIGSGRSVEDALIQGTAQLNGYGFGVQYLAYVDADTLDPASKPLRKGRLIVAAKLGSTRLIDNVDASF